MVHHGGAHPIVIIGNPSSIRVGLFQQTLQQLNLPPANVLPYMDLITGAKTLSDLIVNDAIVRIESPGKDFSVQRALLELGEETTRREGYTFIAQEELGKLSFDRGRILAPRQWYHGFRIILNSIKEQLAALSRNVSVMNHPDDIAIMFDKTHCHQMMAASGVPVPRGLGPVGSFDDLRDRMGKLGVSQVFIKSNHGSSASGIVAYRTNGRAHRAITTVEAVRAGGDLFLYNSRKIRSYENEREIAELIDALCGHKVHVEEWFPKAKINGKKFDLRIVMIDRTVRHTVVRESDSPFTNLHLLNRRSEFEPVRAKLGSGCWEQIERTCEGTMKLFERSLYAGIDLMIGTNFRSHAIAEINAFGDHINNALWYGRDTYSVELECLHASNWLRVDCLS